MQVYRYNCDLKFWITWNDWKAKKKFFFLRRMIIFSSKFYAWDLYMAAECNFFLTILDIFFTLIRDIFHGYDHIYHTKYYC